MTQDLTLFNRVLFGMGVLALGLIAIFSFRYAQNQRTTVTDFVAADSLIDRRWFQNLDGTDSLQLSSYKGREVLLVFWASWSDRSLEVLEQLDASQSIHSDSIVIVAAAVKDNGEEARAYIQSTSYPFNFVEGTIHYLDLRLPGVPSAIRFNRDTKPTQIYIGEKQILSSILNP